MEVFWRKERIVSKIILGIVVLFFLILFLLLFWIIAFTFALLVFAREEKKRKARVSSVLSVERE